jgi:hypothetical protein
MEEEKLLKELERNFEKMKSNLKMKSGFEDIDKIFYIKDEVLKDSFVSEDLARQILHKIVETYMSWNEYLHSLVMPNPQNLLNISESKIFDQEERKEILELIKKAMEISSRSSLITLTRDKEAEGKLMDHSVKYWNEEFKPKLVKIMKKINEEWNKTK